MRVWRGVVSHAPAGVDSPPPAQCLSDAPTNTTLQRLIFCVMSGKAQLNQGREGKGYIAVPACGGSLAEAKRACNQNCPI
eukprot:1143969-Pelagomonas_calceolata.AAC.1